MRAKYLLASDAPVIVYLASVYLHTHQPVAVSVASHVALGKAIAVRRAEL